VSDAIAAQPRALLLERLEAAGVPATPVNTVDQLLADPQTRSRTVIRRMRHPKLGDIPVVGMPLTFSAMQPDIRRHAPGRGEHTDDVLHECGYSTAEIATLREKKVVA
jgi:crotonobetainyl-CoA:carnitine CoA-transferase CaiB-like acyl-CoA transferase